MKSRKLVLVAALILNSAIFAQNTTSNTVNGDGKNKVEKELKERAKEIQDDVVKIRGLQFKEPVDVGVYTIKELKAFLKKEVDDSLTPEKDDGYTKAYVKLGVMPPDTDLKEAYLKLLVSQIGGFYDPRSKQLKLIDRTSADSEDKDDEFNKQLKATDEMLKMAKGISLDDFLMSHELTHAAQDQNFNLLTLPLDNDSNDDLALAVKCVVEGDACVVMYAYLLGDQSGAVDSLMAMLPDGGASLMGNMPLPKVPDFLTQQLVFPYTYGFSFIQKAKSKWGWKKVNQLFEDLPASTSQILHPDKFFKNRVNPQEIKLPDVPNILGAGYKVCLSNVIGEFSLRLILKQFKVQRVNTVANGWDGDEFEVLDKTDTAKTGDTAATATSKVDPNKLVLVWMTTWENEEDAQRFSDAYQRVLEKKYPNAKLQDRDKSTALYKYLNTDGTISSAERKDKDVLILESVPQDKFSNLRESLWSQTTKKEVKKVERVEPKTPKK